MRGRTDTSFTLYSLFGWSALVCLWIAANVIIYEMCHDDLHRKGLEIVNQVSLAGLNPNESKDKYVIEQMLVKTGFSLAEIESQQKGWFYSHLENEVFTAKGITLSLRHATIGIYYAHWFVGALLFFSAVGFGYFRWLKIYQRKQKLSEKLNITETPTAKTPSAKTQHETVNMLLVEQYALFALVSFDYKLPADCDAESYFKISLAKAFAKPQKSRVKYLNDGVLAVTFPLVAKSELHDITAIVHEQVFKSLKHFRHDLSRKVVKVGACYYPHKAEQAKVYQLARSALTVAANNLWHHYHCLPLNHTQSELFSTGQDVMDYLEKGKYLILFQPIIGFDQQDIIASEALLRVRHDKIGLMSAKQFMFYLREQAHFVELDKYVIQQVMNVLNKEPSNLDVHVNIHSMSWCNAPFSRWLSEQLSAFVHRSKLVFEISANDFYQYNVQLHGVFKQLDVLGVRVIVDHVDKMLDVTKFRAQPAAIVGLKLSVELVQSIEVDLARQRLVRDVVTQAKAIKLPVFAVGVESHQTLLSLQKLGIKAAQGHYFSEPLQQFSDSDLKSGHDT